VDNLSSKLSIYLRGSGASLLATIVSKASGFASIWLLNRILVKGSYGNYEFAFTIVGLLMLAGSGGLNHAVMYRLSRLDAPPEELDGHDFAGAVLGWGLIISCLFAGLVFVGAPYVEVLAGNEGLAFWVSLLSFLVPIRVAQGVYKSWFKARQRIPEAMLIGKMLPAIGKAGFLGGVWMIWPTPEGVVMAILLSGLIPLLIWYGRTPVNPLNLWGQLSSWDIWYSLKLALTKGLSKTLKRADLLMVGFLAVAEATAEYAVAAKISLFLVVGHSVLNTVLRPRIGRFLGQHNWKSISREYDQSRTVALLFTLLGTCVLALLGEPILELFGDYSAAYPVLIMLAASHVVSTSFGMAGGYLNIAGYAGWTLGTTITLLILNVSLNYVLIPLYGALGASIATLISYGVVNAVVAAAIYYLDGLKIYSIKLLGVTGGAVLIAGGLAAEIVPVIHGVAGLIGITTCTLYMKYQKIRGILKVLIEEKLSKEALNI